MRGKKSLTSSVLDMARSHVENFGVMYWNDMEGEMGIHGFDRGKYVMGRDTLRRKPLLSGKPKR